MNQAPTMTRSRLLFFLLSALVVIALLGGNLLGAAAGGDEGGDDSLYKHLSVFTEVLGLIRQAYVDEPNVDALMAGALDGTTDALDPFSIYVPATEVGPYVQAREIGNRLTGLTLLRERGVAYVVAVDPGSPAAEAGVEVSDLVAKIQGESTRTMPLWEVQEQLVGAPGTRIEMELIRMGESRQASLELRAFDPPPVSFTDAPGGGGAGSADAAASEAFPVESAEPVGLLRVARFEASTAAAVRKALAGAAGRDLLLDLRGVAGGDPTAAYAVAELFAKGELGGLTRKGARLESFAGEAEPVWRGHLVVLVSRGTLGAAEVLATVLRQKAGAELVGERTFGWAGRQDSVDIASGGRLFFTDAFYTGPDGSALKESLEPDHLVDASSRRFGDRDEPVGDLILERGLERVRALADEAAVGEKKAA
jgi:carboxyl-terminal processing protease